MTWTGRTEAEGKKNQEEGMQTAAGSTVPAPTRRYSQKGVKKLLSAAAADEEGLHHGDVTVCVFSEDRHRARPHAHTTCVGAYLPHPPPPIGGGLGPAPWVIRPIRLLPPGGPGGPLPSLKRDEATFPFLDKSGWIIVLKKRLMNSTAPQKRSVR